MMEGQNMQGAGYIDYRAMKRLEEEGKISHREKISMILMALVLGIVFDYLFYGKTLGASYPIFILLLLGFFMYSARDKITHSNIFGWFLLSAIFLLSLTFAIYSNIFLRVLNFLAVPVLIVMYTITSTDKNMDWSKSQFFIDMLEKVFVSVFSCMLKPFKFIKETYAKAGSKKGIKPGEIS
jgi:hypothetical protein